MPLAALRGAAGGVRKDTHVKRIRGLGRWAPLAALAMLLSACSLTIQDGPLDSLAPEGPIARDLAHLYWMVFWIAVAVFVLVQGGLVYLLIRFRAREGDTTEPKQIHGNAKLEVVWTIIPVLILAAIAVPTVSRVFKYTECAPDAYHVNVIGHQWFFEFFYPDTGIWTANELVIPTNQEVCLSMESEDVIHNFWIPKLNGKRYVIPGETTTLLMLADKPGEYFGHCAEFCGLSHARMRMRVIAVEPADFAAWQVAQAEPASEPAPGSLEAAGLDYFNSLACAGCHLIRGVNNSAISNFTAIGPELTHFASRGSFAGSTLEAEDPDALAKWLSDPPTWKPGSYMPNLDLSADQIEALVAYLRSLD